MSKFILSNKVNVEGLKIAKNKTINWIIFRGLIRKVTDIINIAIVIVGK